MSSEFTVIQPGLLSHSQYLSALVLVLATDGAAGVGDRAEGGSMIFPALVCVSACLSVTTITKKIVYGLVPNFTGRFSLLRGKGRPSSCFVTIGRGMWNLK